jgi:glycosyltransferase involved in cell wall biosynthesis
MTVRSGRVPTVHVLLATFRGERYLDEQLASIAAQTHTAWSLLISDDGSNDRTLEICHAFAARHPGHQVRVEAGPRKHSTANFLHLVRTVDGFDEADLFAFCDQDDVWLPEKLARAVAAIQAAPLQEQQAALYGARTRLVDHRLTPIGISRLPVRPLGFGNALLQNVASGNTMVFNAALLRLLRCVDPANAVLHDWTAYQAVTGCGGWMFFDPAPCLLYRQHDHNLIGSQGRSWDKVQRMGMLFKGQYRAWGDLTEAAMKDLKDHLTPEALRLLRNFQHMRRQPHFAARLRAGAGSGLWRQTRSGRASFWLGLALNRM